MKMFVFFIFKLISIRMQLLYNIVFISTAQQSESAICLHLSPLFFFLPFRASESTE